MAVERKLRLWRGRGRSSARGRSGGATLARGAPLAGEADARAILVQTWLRRLVFPDQRLTIEEPRADTRSHDRGSVLMTALSGAAASLAMRDRAIGAVAAAVVERSIGPTSGARLLAGLA